MLFYPFGPDFLFRDSWLNLFQFGAVFNFVLLIQSISGNEFYINIY